MATEGMARYAAEIYRLQEGNTYVNLSELAEHAGASLQATSRMIARLKQAGYIKHEPYRGFLLTPAGEQIAIPAIRRHRVVEVFLVKILGFGWHEVHNYSDKFELGVDNRIEDHLYEAAGRPERCPHGEPIPGKDGKMPVLHDTSLPLMEIGKKYCISRVRVHDEEKLAYLGELGLVPSTILELASLAPFQGPVRIRRSKQELVLSYELASALYVDRVD
jgi:DtxR family transcriptional regulator, Mn-dependent transcriptional regulator